MNLKFKVYIIFSILIIFHGSYKSQNLKYCGTDEAMKQLLTTHPELLQSIIENEQYYNTNSNSQKNMLSTTVYTIPVVFHVLHQNGLENISDAQIIDGINILNRDMRKLNGDTINIIPRFKPLASDIRVVFELAKLDPQGNCTNGIDRIYTSKTNYGDDSAKVNPWPRDKYLNIWTAKYLKQGWAGYAYYPSAATGSLSVHDGLMILADYIGSIGTSNVNKSRTLTHEVGHWLDLGHPWNTTINISINVGVACGDDLIEDTPTTKGHTACPNLLTPDCIIDDFSDGIFDFAGVTTTSGSTDISSISSTFDSLTVTPFSANGLSANSGQNGAFSFSDWSTGANDGETSYAALTGTLNSLKYYEITVAPKPSSSMSLTGLKFTVNRTLTGPRTYAVRSSIDGFTSNLTASISPINSNLSVNSGNIFFYNNDVTNPELGSVINLSGTNYTHKDVPITFRIYAWNAEDNLGEFLIDNVSIIGSTGIIENIQNYMEYSYCCNMWTVGQKNRMRLAIESPVSGRNNLWSSANLIATGVSSPSTICAPKPDFYASRTKLCKGNNIAFTKNVLNGTETSRVWTFEGGTPATSTAENPTVTYSASGIYSVSLSATNASGSNTVTKTQYIRVDNTVADVVSAGNYYEGFETSTLLNGTWQSIDVDNNGHKWSYAPNSGTSGSNAVVMNGFGNYGQDIDELISPSFDLTSNLNQSLFFKVAAASITTLTPEIKDELKVFFSVNCGTSWVQRAVYTGTTLINNPATASALVPNTSSVWTTHSIPIGTFFQTSNLLVKFQYKSIYTSNNIYLDDINISSQVAGINNADVNNLNLTIFPNPTDNDFVINYFLNNESLVGLQVTDVLGKTIYNKTPSIKTEGNYTEVLSSTELNLNNGVYLIKLRINDNIHTKKIIISK